MAYSVLILVTSIFLEDISFIFSCLDSISEDHTLIRNSSHTNTTCWRRKNKGPKELNCKQGLHIITFTCLAMHQKAEILLRAPSRSFSFAEGLPCKFTSKWFRSFIILFKGIRRHIQKRAEKKWRGKGLSTTIFVSSLSKSCSP